MSAAEMAAAEHMDRMYRHQRHVYDLTRRYYLLGRDQMIAGLDAPARVSILEVGCGTGRNLIHAARRYPHARLYGFDISGEMLETAGGRIASARLTHRIRLAQADATRFDPHRSFGKAGFDRVFLSYTLSMIPDWGGALDCAWASVATGGSLHIVDFGQQQGLPAWFRLTLFAWLARFSVTPRARLRVMLQSMASESDARLERRSLYRGYSELAVLARP